MKHGVARYYEQFPERAFDERSKAALEHSVAGLECILEVLDRYEITRKEK